MHQIHVGGLKGGGGHQKIIKGIISKHDKLGDSLSIIITVKIFNYMALKTLCIVIGVEFFWIFPWKIMGTIEGLMLRSYQLSTHKGCSALKSGHFGWSFHSRITAAGYYYYFPLSFAKTSDPKLIANWSLSLVCYFFSSSFNLSVENVRNYCGRVILECRKKL